MKTLNGQTIKKMLGTAYGLMDQHKGTIDALNVFPVPDGDTGINMCLTLKSVMLELELVSSNDATNICEAITRGALKGARGNSGVILSQILKGIMQVLGAKRPGGGEVNAKVFADAMDVGQKVAYKAVTVPKEGTMLTVIRVMAEEAKKIARTNAEFETFITKVLEKGEEILAQTPEMLPVLKKAGVVDAGGRGILVIFSGFLAAINGKEIPIDLSKDSQGGDGAGGVAFEAEGLGDIEFAYCTEFMITNMYKTTTMASIDSLRDRLMTMGDSVVCVGDLEMVKVHVHTNTPGIAITAALNLGEMTKLKVDNMLEQNREMRKANKIEDKDQGIVVVAAGEGLINVFKDLGVDYVIKGGQTMNPSAEDIAEAVRRVHAKNVYVFPNNSNILLAAKHAQSLSKKNIIVIPTKTVNEGVSACIMFDPDASIEENTEQFLSAMGSVKSGSVTYASRNTKMNRFEIKEGEIIGLDNKTILAKGNTPKVVATTLITKMMSDDITNVTMFYGADVREKDAMGLQDELMKKFPQCEINVIMGGQPIYYYLISLE